MRADDQRFGACAGDDVQLVKTLDILDHPMPASVNRGRCSGNFLASNLVQLGMDHSEEFGDPPLDDSTLDDTGDYVLPGSNQDVLDMVDNAVADAQRHADAAAALIPDETGIPSTTQSTLDMIDAVVADAHTVAVSDDAAETAEIADKYDRLNVMLSPLVEGEVMRHEATADFAEIQDGIAEREQLTEIALTEQRTQMLIDQVDTMLGRST